MQDRQAIEKLNSAAKEQNLDIEGGKVRRTSSRFCLGVEHGDYNGTELFGVGTDRFIWFGYKLNGMNRSRLFSVNVPNDGVIDFEINNDGTKLVPKTKPIGSCNAAHRKNGCFVVPHNETTTITFRLKNSKKWYIDEFRVCQGIDKPGVCSLEDWQQKEFGAFLKTGDAKTPPDSYGRISISSLSTKRVRSFKLADYNGVPQDYFYSIIACTDIKDDGGETKKKCVPTDPAIQNKGRN